MGPVMDDAPAIATILFVLAWFAGRGVLLHLERRDRRAACAGLLQRHLAHWHYGSQEWAHHCERRRSELWFGYLRPAARFLGPGLVVAIAISPVLGARAGLAPGPVALIVAALGFVIALQLLGPALREFIRLSFRRRLEYEIYLGEPGVLEVWREGERIRAMEEHLYAGGAIERVEASGVDPAEIVFSIGRPLSWGVLHLEEHFLVPRGHLAEAREIARRLSLRSKPRDA